MKLVTFGCSWTNGVGMHYTKGMSREEYCNKRKGNNDIKDKYAFRGILAERFGYTNINFAKGGHSNQKQERFAIEYFNENLPDDTVVLWGLTTIARTEFCMDDMWTNVMSSECERDERIEYYFKHFYNEKLELERLCNMMIHWNKFFEAHKIPNLWFQTFNTYEFPQNIDRLLPKDLLTYLTCHHTKDYHASTWKVDSKRIEEAKDKGLVNPISLHPTKETHIILADILEKKVREILY